MTGPDKQFWVVVYDIADTRRLRRVAKHMEGYGTRVQRSVFDCWLSEADLDKLRASLNDIIAPGIDSVRFYHVCDHCRQRSERDTETQFMERHTFYIV